jgi:basic membrane protein A
MMVDLATTGLYDLIMAIGSDLAGAVEAVASNHPTQKFGMVGSDLSSYDNVASVVFSAEQAAFIGGVVAAFLASEYDGRIGVLAAMEGDIEIDPLINGFIQGVQASNATYTLDLTITEVRYIDGWNDTDQAEDDGFDMFNGTDGVDVLFAPIRASMPGLRSGALAATMVDGNSTTTRVPYIIAAEGNQDYFGTADPDIPVDPSMITCSVLSRTDLAFYDIVNRTMWDEFPGGELFEYNLMNGGVNITDFEYSTTYIGEDIRDAIEYYREYIANNPSFVTP